ncbi:MAG: phage head closure protein [Comamonas sp.]|uniref:phage head closure protein n=1 Tax=Comamonas sp. TaxID=34028 RepID=UPI002FCAD3BE
MKAGDLKHHITIERATIITDSRGNRRESWEPIATCWASMADVSGRDFYAAQAYQAQDTVTFGIRWRDDIDKECRINHGGAIYLIEQINHLGYKHDFIHLKARLTQGEGV